MATVTQTRHTPEDLLAIEDRPMPELVDGRLLEREMGQKSDGIGAYLIYLLITHVHPGNLGFVNGGQGSYQIFPDDPNKVRIPDVSFTRRERLPDGRPFEGHGRVAPDLVVEVISPNDTVEKLEEKLADYEAAGIPLIWVVYPGIQAVEVIREDGTRARLKVGDVLDGEDILPGFRCEVAALFA